MTEFITGTDPLDPHYKAEVLADSMSPDGIRLTTFRLTYPRFIHSEMMTHRDKSRNAASSRAIPTERLIKMVKKDRFAPATYNKRVTGMGVGEEISGWRRWLGRQSWMIAAWWAASIASVMVWVGMDKSRANRILEPFLWYTAIFSGTDWENMLSLRDHAGAQPEIQATARSIRQAFERSEPQKLDYGQWHLPLVTKEELAELCSVWQQTIHAEFQFDEIAEALEKYKKISASRCARVSYDRFDDEPIQRTLERAETLMGNGHFSPFEHVARPFSEDEEKLISKIAAVANTHDGLSTTMRPVIVEQLGYVGNFFGWVQMRKEIPFEARFDLAQGDS